MACINSKRGPNFSIREVEKLIQLVKLHWHVINNKGTDSATNASKIDAWKAIEKAFNEDDTCNIYRPHYVLRTKFDNLKRLKKRNPSTQKFSKLNKDGDPTDSPTNDVEEDNFEILKSAIAAAKKKKNFNESFDLNINDSSSETIECIYSETETTPSLVTAVTAFFQESDEKYFENENDQYENIVDGENEEFEYRRITPHDRMTSEPQDSCITQSSEESLTKKRKCYDSPSVSKGFSATEFGDLRKRAFLEKHSLTLRLLKEEAEQRMKHESIMNELREEELRLRIQFMKEKHKNYLNLMKDNSTLDK